VGRGRGGITKNVGRPKRYNRLVAICIVIRKESETEREVIYSFGPGDPRMGRLMTDKRSGEILKVSDVDGDRIAFNFSRAANRLKQHYALGEFPAETMYTA